MGLFRPCGATSEQMAPTGGHQLDGMDMKLTPSFDGCLFDAVWWSGLILATLLGESLVVRVFSHLLPLPPHPTPPAPPHDPPPGSAHPEISAHLKKLSQNA